MGSKLVEYYQKADEIGGFKAKMRLAVITKVASAKAAEAEDSPENIKIFEAAIREIKKEF